MAGQDPRKLIIDSLRKHPEGLTITSIASLTGLHRHTSTKYIHELIGAGVVRQRQIGPARLCYLEEKLKEKKSEEELIEKLDRRRFGVKSVVGIKSQVQIAAFVVLTVLLLSQIGIFAENLTHLMDGTNLSQSPATGEIVLSEPNTSSEGVVSTEQSASAQSGGIVENATSPEVVYEQSNVQLSGTENYPSETAIGNVVLNVSVEAPSKITRGETATIRATITNVGPSTAKNVVLTWQLSNGFEIISGKLVENCGDLETDVSCVSEIVIRPTFSTGLGRNEIMAVVSYE
jgi:uncharacterized repeat protein (TIGR01451 family)